MWTVPINSSLYDIGRSPETPEGPSRGPHKVFSGKRNKVQFDTSIETINISGDWIPKCFTQIFTLKDFYIRVNSYVKVKTMSFSHI